MGKTILIIMGLALIVFGIMSFLGYYVAIEPLWFRVIVIVMGGISFLAGIFIRGRRR